MKQEKFIIRGGKPLRGEIEVLGAKNAALPIIAASILFREPVTLDNIPLIEDVFRMIDILKSIGAKVAWSGKRKVVIDNANIEPERIDQKLVQMLRASILLAGPLMARFGKCVLAHPGGCAIGSRPLDTHFGAFKELGVNIHVIEKSDYNLYEFDASNSHGGEVTLEEFSVTATENMLLFASLLEESVKIKIAAAEPHVQDLISFLQRGGVSITKEGDHTILIRGKKNLNLAEYGVINDYIEAGTFLVLSILYKGAIVIKNAPYQYLDASIKKLEDMGVTFDIKSDSMVLSVPPCLTPVKIQTLPYPGFPTDLQAPFGVLMTQAKGKSFIHDPLYENRFGYLKELQKMQAKATQLNAHEALIEGQTPLQGASIQSFDLRAGITLILAGLIAEGETIIENVYQVDRGYERIDERLRPLGADIKRVA